MVSELCWTIDQLSLMLLNQLMHCHWPVDWAAHLGGLIAGLLVGIPIFALHIESMVWRTLWVVTGSGATIMCFVWSLTYMYSGAIEPAEELRDVCGKSTASISCSKHSELLFTHKTGLVRKQKVTTKSSSRIMSVLVLENDAADETEWSRSLCIGQLTIENIFRVLPFPALLAVVVSSTHNSTQHTTTTRLSSSS